MWCWWNVQDQFYQESSETAFYPCKDPRKGAGVYSSSLYVGFLDLEKAYDPIPPGCFVRGTLGLWGIGAAYDCDPVLAVSQACSQ